jgi:dolichol-phosphate mannosyltransferase
MDGLDVSVVLPTYQESASLPVLVPRIARALESAGLRGEIIVVDDDSPDGTAAVARQLAETYPMQVCHRTAERGLATAVIAGFRMSRATVCVVMDADGSHPVEALGDMVRLILEDKAEIVVGSRHVPGGGSQDWPLFSRFKSRFAASLALGLTSMTDPTTGFMAIRRSKLEALELDPVGWKIVLEAVVKAHPARVAEVPIVFTDRELGESKQTLRVLGQYLLHLYKLYDFRFPGFVELIKFCLVGGLGVFVDLSVVASLKELAGMDTRLCQVFGFAAAVTFNYAINRRFSFKDAHKTPLLYSYVAYVAANLVGLSLRMLVIQLMMAMTQLDRGYGYLLLSLLGIAVATVVNFVGVKYFAFAPERLEPAAEPSGDEEVRVAGPSRGAALLAAGLSAAIVGWALLRPHALTDNEQDNLRVATHMLVGPGGFVHPSKAAGAVADWQRDALPELGNTPIYPLLLAGASTLGRAGLTGLGVLTWLLMLAGSALTMRRLDAAGSRAVLLMAAGAPALLRAFALLDFEPAVAALGILGFAALTRTGGRHNGLYAALAGLGLGLGFAVKMWLVLPAALACLGYLVSRGYRARGEARAALQRAALVFVASAGAAGLSHLMFVALVAPDDFRAWLDWVYLAIFTGRGATGPKLSSGDPMWGSDPLEPFLYALLLLRDHGAMLVPIVLGLPAATRRVRREEGALYAAVLGALFALVPLSVPSAKTALYMLPMLPFFYVLAAHAVAAPDRLPARLWRVNRGAARASLVVAGLLAAGHLVALAVYGAILHSLHHALVSASSLALVAVWSAPSVAVLRGRAVSPVLTASAFASLGIAAFQLFVLG